MWIDTGTALDQLPTMHIAEPRCLARGSSARFDVAEPVDFPSCELLDVEHAIEAPKDDPGLEALCEEPCSRPPQPLDRGRGRFRPARLA